ncbi:ketopantoate reductase family protein [Roseomonas sp. BN140053]|uniref:ketopantoate reductase family protein n=1 Tax=Roseomonas sp. BN140053 TaxID=3391898 RepID=UPI0039E8A71D
MKICIFGAGAIGGHLAVRFAHGGATVSVVARGNSLRAIREQGLTVQAPDVELRAKVHAAEDPAELGPQDAVVVTVKAPSLPDVARGIAPLLGAHTAVVFAMNGIPWWYFDRIGGPMEGRKLPELDPGEGLRRAVGVGRTIGGVVYSACTVVEPGVIRVAHTSNRLFLGEIDGSAASDRIEAIAAPLRAGGFEVPVTADIRREAWAKLLGNISGGPLAVLSRQDMRATFADPAIRAAAVRMTEEAAAIARGLGIPLEVDAEKQVTRSGSNQHKPSILQDLELGRPMEVEAMLAVPLKLARFAGVETPTLDLMVALASKTAEAAGLYRPAG